VTQADSSSEPDKPLAGRVCIVAGASRGVGRGIALALGEAGATVICVARSTRFGARTEGRGETTEDTAEAVGEAGGQGHPYVCDCTDTRALHDFSAWVLRRFGPPSLLACAVWGGNEGYDGDAYADGARFGTPFHQRSLSGLETALGSGAYALMATARAIAPIMIPSGRGLLAAVGFDGEGRFLGDPWYDLGQAAMLRAAQLIARDIGPSGIACIHLTPGFVRTERVLAARLGGEATESPLYAGRAVAALAADPQVRALNGRSLFVADLARHYGFTDADGAQPSRFVPPD
jgi:NAD(P)-dependent dehydrogenase (short-subunit alcohol dehydrogenase family)